MRVRYSVCACCLRRGWKCIWTNSCVCGGRCEHHLAARRQSMQRMRAERDAAAARDACMAAHGAWSAQRRLHMRPAPRFCGHVPAPWSATTQLRPRACSPRMHSCVRATMCACMHVGTAGRAGVALEHRTRAHGLDAPCVRPASRAPGRPRGRPRRFATGETLYASDGLIHNNFYREAADVPHAVSVDAAAGGASRWCRVGASWRCTRRRRPLGQGALFPSRPVSFVTRRACLQCDWWMRCRGADSGRPACTSWLVPHIRRGS